MDIIGGVFTKEDQLCADLRRLQQRCGCTDATCDDILNTFKKYLGINAPTNFRKYDSKMREAAGAEMLRLNGCPHCKRHVYLPTDKAQTCPHVKKNGTVCGHPRYDEAGKPLEVCMLPFTVDVQQTKTHHTLLFAFTESFLFPNFKQVAGAFAHACLSAYVTTRVFTSAQYKFYERCL